MASGRRTLPATTAIALGALESVTITDRSAVGTAPPGGGAQLPQPKSSGSGGEVVRYRP